MSIPYRVVIQNAWQYDSLDIYVLDEQLGKRYVMNPGGGPGGASCWTEVQEAAEQDIQPTVRLPNTAAHELVQALSELGVKTDKDAKIEGTLEATRYHLEDMRVLAGVVAPPGRLVSGSKEE